MSESQLEQEAAEIAAFLGLEWEYNGTSVADGIVFCDVLLHPLDAMWTALLRLARQPRGLPAEAPEGHERVRIGLWEDPRDGEFTAGVILREGAADPQPLAIVTADVPRPKPVDVVGSVE